MSEPVPTGDAAPPATRPASATLLAQVGGVRGLIDSGVPTLVFVAANTVAGLRTAIWTAVGAGLLIVVVRLARREPLQQAVSGFLGLALAAFIAARMGQARGFFLPGIAFSVAYGLLFLGSVVVRRPLVGILWSVFDEDAHEWRDHPRLRSVFVAATLAWAAVFFVRAGVQGLLYLADKPGWLAVAKLALGYPVTAAAVLATVVAVRRARRRLHPEDARLSVD